ncbi:MAG: hypothetical protein IT337_12490 [Thermomicrobiales bacterium]|nr:hypothetical protein [Thermomicrobiales bacterium]
MPSWQDFERDEQAKAPPELAACCARVLAGPDGRELLALLRARLFDAVLGPAAPEPVLRSREAQRHLVRDLERWRDQGLAALGGGEKGARNRPL